MVDTQIEVRTSDDPQPASVWHSSATKKTLNQQLIEKLLAYADELDILESKGSEINKIIEQHISMPPKPDYAGAIAAIHELRPQKGPQKAEAQAAQAVFKLSDWIEVGKEYDHKALLKVYRAALKAYVGKQLRETLQSLHKSGLVTMPTVEVLHEPMDFLTGIIALSRNNNSVFPGCLVLHEMPQEQGDPLVDGLIADGARGVEIEDTPPKAGSGGTDNMPNEADEWFGPKPVQLREKWTCESLEDVAQYKACFNHWQREVYKRKPGLSFSDLGDLTRKTLQGMDLQRSIDERGITITVDLLQECIDQLDGKEPAMTTENKEKHWSEDVANWNAMADSLVPSAIEMGFDADPTVVMAEACKALGLAKVSDFQGKGSQFKPQVLKAWKAQKDEAKPKEPVQEPAKEGPKPAESIQEATKEDKPAEVPKKLEAHPFLSEVKTLTGIPVGRISEAMNRHFPKEAYGEIPNGPMKGGTDLGFEYVRDRFDQVFGPHGFGWKFEPHPVLGKIEYHTDVKGDGPTWHVVTFVCHVLKYAVIVNDQITWMELSPMSDSDKNVDCGYAYRGAFTSLLKQALRGFGGMNHILKGEYTHQNAKVA